MNLIKKHTPIFLRKITPLFRGEFCKSPLVPPDKCHSHESGNPVEIRDCGFPIPDISGKKKGMNIKMNKGNKMKTRLTKGIILVLGMSLFFSSLIFAGPNENAGIVFDLDATTYGNQNLTNIPSQPAGTYIRLDVYCTGVQNLDTYEFEVIYDPTELAYVAASAANLITFEPNILTTNGGEAIGWMIDTSTPGVLSLAYTLAGVDTLEAPEGEGLIADIVFQAQVATHGTLSFGDVHFYDSFEVMDIITDKGIAILYEFGNIDGTVTDANNGEPIEGAIVSIGDFSDTTGTNGTYLLEYVPPGIHDITCTAEGYYDTVDVVEVLEGQTVTIDFVLEPFHYGTLDGTVTDANNGEPIEDALITATSQGKVEYTGFTNADGYYIIDSLLASEIVGNYIVICDAGVPYTSGEVTDVEIIEDEITTIDFVLTSPIMVVDPTSINVTIIPPDDTLTTYITVSNTGSAPLEWTVDIQFPDRQVINIPPATTDFPRSEDKLSLSLAPQNGEPTNSSTTPMINLLRGTTAYAFNMYPGSDFVTFDTDVPGTWLTTIPITYSPFAADFDIDDNFYAVDYNTNNLYAVDIETGVFTLIGPTQASTDLACDKTDGTMYAASYYGSNSYLYTIELTTGSATLIGLINAGGLIISMACDGEGNLWGFDIVDDALYAIDKDDGHGTYVGLVGFDGNYAQSMAWDPESEIVYMAAYNNTVGAGQLRIVDTSTGATALVGTFSGGAEVTGLGFQGGGARWIWLSEYSGIVPPGCDSLVTVYFDACEDPAGTIHTCDIFFESDPDVGTVTVPVTLMVGEPEYGDLNGYVTAATGGAPIEGAEIIAGTYTDSTDEYGYYEILDMMVGYYTVECTAVGYNSQLVPDVPIVVDQTTTLNFALLAPIMVVDPTLLNVIVPPGSTDSTYFTIYNNGDGEMNFDITLYDYGKVLTDYSNCSNGGTVVSKNGVQTGPGNSSGFQADGTKDEVIIHYDGENYDAIGLTSGGTFMVAARFTSDELGIYYDTYEITGVELYINDTGSALTLKIWEGGSFGNPGSEIYSQDVFGSIVAESWNILDLTTNVPLLAGNEYWVGYETTHLTGEYPAGCDAGPAVVGKGDWIYLAPGPWEQLHVLAPALNYNWNIRMVIDFGTAPWIIVDPLFGTIPAYSSMPISVMFDATELTQGEIKTADIEIVSDPDVGVVIVPVTMLVGEAPSAGEISVKETKLYANFPNPMLNSTTFNFSLKDRSHVTLSIYNVKGQLVGILLDNELDPSADHKVVWDGTANGKQLANGIYFYKLETNSKTFLKKMLLMK